MRALVPIVLLGDIPLSEQLHVLFAVWATISHLKVKLHARLALLDILQMKLSQQNAEVVPLEPIKKLLANQNVWNAR
jgi:hypothetical protein